MENGVPAKKVMLVLSTMKGGGAERVASLLANEFLRNGWEPQVVLTSCKAEDAVRVDLDEQIPLITLPDLPDPGSFCSRAAAALGRPLSTLICRPFELLHKPVPAGAARFSFWSRYRGELGKLKELLRADPEKTALAFLQPSIPLTVLAAEDLPNRVVISERGDPKRLMGKRYGRKFIEKYYTRVDAAVFQTEDAKRTYPDCVSDKGRVIFNPLKEGLPQPYDGERRKTIVTFCRISAQKNLPLLLEAFRRLHGDHPDYSLRIIGDAVNDADKKLETELKAFVAENGLGKSVSFEPFSPDVHGLILSDGMYVNSSDFEGMSNAMLESMTIGLPTVCTDCPIGGANAAIRDGENGLLTPVGDAEALYRAMKRVIEEPGLAEKLSENGRKLRDELRLEAIAKKWMELL